MEKNELFKVWTRYAIEERERERRGRREQAPQSQSLFDIGNESGRREGARKEGEEERRREECVECPACMLQVEGGGGVGAHQVTSPLAARRDEVAKLNFGPQVGSRG